MFKELKIKRKRLNSFYDGIFDYQLIDTDFVFNFKAKEHESFCEADIIIYNQYKERKLNAIQNLFSYYIWLSKNFHLKLNEVFPHFVHLNKYINKKIARSIVKEINICYKNIYYYNKNTMYKDCRCIQYKVFSKNTIEVFKLIDTEFTTTITITHSHFINPKIGYTFIAMIEEYQKRKYSIQYIAQVVCDSYVSGGEWDITKKNERQYIPQYN